MSHIYDAVIIGSGIGGLTCGAFLTRAGMRVLVLEQHTKIGGYAHSFTRKKFIFESGIHSVSMSDQGLIKHLLRLLGIENKVEAIEYPEMYSVSTPVFSMSMPSRKDEVFDFLTGKFPNQKDNIKNLFDQAKIFYKNIIDPIFEYEHYFQEESRNFVSQYHNKSYGEFISSIISDEKLKLLFGGQWPYVGTSPDYSPNLFTFMMYLVHLLEGSHCCKNGFSTLASTLASVIIQGGGKILTKSKVKTIIIDKKHARGIRTEKGDEFESDLIISNISPYLVHNKLISKEYQSRRWQRRISNLNTSISSVILYLGMNQKVDELIPYNIHFWYASTDYNSIFLNVLQNKKDHIDHLIFLKSIKNENQTLTIMNFVQNSFSTNWKSEKMKIANKMLEKAEEIFPGLHSLIEIKEVGSPNTFERYTSNTDGALYGFENTKSMYGEAKMPMTTHIENLYQTGHWGKPGCSIWNVMSNAYTVSKIILR